LNKELFPQLGFPTNAMFLIIFNQYEV